MTSKLGLYNKAALHLSQARLSDLDEDVLVKRELDAVYDDVLRLCLEEGLWKWALRTVEISPDPDIDTAEFGGLQYGYTLPDDYVRAANISNTPNFNVNTSGFEDHEITGPGKILWTNLSLVYLRYVSTGETYGLNLAVWPETFANAVGARLAQHVAGQVTKSVTDESNAEKKGDKWMAQAKIRDSLDDKVKRGPVGTLVRSRLGMGRVRTRGPLWG